MWPGCSQRRAMLTTSAAQCGARCSHIRSVGRSPHGDRAPPAYLFTPWRAGHVTQHSKRQLVMVQLVLKLPWQLAVSDAYS